MMPTPPPFPSAPPPSKGQHLTVPQALQLAAQQIDNGQLPQAEAILRQILSQFPGHPEAMHLLGVLAHVAGQTSLAVELIGKAIAIQPGNAHFHANRGEMCRLLKRLDEAVGHGEMAISLAPDQAAYHSNLGIAYYDKKDYDRAEACQQRALAIAPDLLTALNNMGSILRERKQREEAIIYYHRVLQRAPDHLDALNNLGAVLVELERPDEGLPFLLQVLKAQPAHADAHNNLANALLAKENYEHAERAYRQALQLRPEHPDATLGLARALHGQDQPEDALPWARHALTLAPDKPEALTLLGNILSQLEAYAEARAAYDHALALDTNQMSAHLGLGQALLELGHLAAAQASFQRAIDLAPDDISPHICMAQARKVTPDDPVLARLAAEAVEADKLLDSKAVSLHFALGKAYDDIKDYDQAFAHFSAACRLKRAGIDYDPDSQDEIFRSICTFFSPETLQRLHGSGSLSDLPIFVLGMPRSGTTLVETIIASHPDVHGAGELRDLLHLAAKPREGYQGEGYPASLRGLTPEDFTRLGERYVSRLRQRNADARRITDKMPTNFLFLGLIHLMLPQAKIVHVRRNAADVCLSTYSKLFSNSQYHTYDLREMGRYYTGYARLMDHWRAVLPPGAFLDIQYEELVADKETQTRRLLDYCGLTWSEACLDPHKNERAIRTASITQVRQPVYRTAVERWRGYEKHLHPLFEALGKHAPR